MIFGSCSGEILIFGTCNVEIFTQGDKEVRLVKVSFPKGTSTSTKTKRNIFIKHVNISSQKIHTRKLWYLPTRFGFPYFKSAKELGRAYKRVLRDFLSKLSNLSKVSA